MIYVGDTNLKKSSNNTFEFLKQIFFITLKFKLYWIYNKASMRRLKSILVSGFAIQIFRKTRGISFFKEITMSH